jgi:hypothetical protein
MTRDPGGLTVMVPMGQLARLLGLRAVEKGAASWAGLGNKRKNGPGPNREQKILFNFQIFNNFTKRFEFK